MVGSVSDFRKKCKSAKVLYCYGAGIIGKRVGRVLNLWKVYCTGYVVSKLDEGMSSDLDMPIIPISDVMYMDGVTFIIAVSNKYQNDIIDNLKKRGFSKYIVLNNDLMRFVKNKLYLEDLKNEYRRNKKFFSDVNTASSGSHDVLHIIKADRKFTTGYVNFMKMIIRKYNHFFAIIRVSDDEVNPVDDKNVFYFENYSDIRNNDILRSLIKRVDKIIVSGIWSGDLGCYPQKVLDKTYLHFWGGDFYGLRYKEENKKVFTRSKRMLKYRLLRRCHAHIFLMKTEKRAFYNITGINKVSYCAPMPGDPLKKDEYIYNKLCIDAHKIIVAVGNSATKENHHVDVFNMLSKWKDKIKVICPLAYGDPEYKRQVIRQGEEILGDSFTPMVDFIDYQGFIDILASCTVGIYYNDRQQAGGNIYINMRLGNKIYLRKGTSMYEEYLDRGCIIYDADNIVNETLEEFVSFSRDKAANNKKVINSMYDMEIMKKEWEHVFESL